MLSLMANPPQLLVSWINNQEGLVLGGGPERSCPRCGTNAGFFLASVAEKTKTQAKKSSKKLKLREALSSLLRETQETNSIFPKNI